MAANPRFDKLATESVANLLGNPDPALQVAAIRLFAEFFDRYVYGVDAIPFEELFRLAGYELVGAHGEAGCRDCHRAESITARANRVTRKEARTKLVRFIASLALMRGGAAPNRGIPIPG